MGNLIGPNKLNFTYGQIRDVHFLCFISNAVLDRPVDNSQNFDGVAYIA